MNNILAFNIYMICRVELLKWIIDTDDDVLYAMLETRELLKKEPKKLDDENLFKVYIKEYEKLELKENKI